MEKYGKILFIAMPLFFILILLEKWYGWYIKKEKINTLDTISSLTSGISMVTKNVLGLSFTILSYEWIVDKVAITHISTSWLTYVIAFVSLDFAHYWIHRIDHKINFFWNSHIVHHSSEEFDLACAVRQPISSFVKIFSIFFTSSSIVRYFAFGHCYRYAYSIFCSVLVSYQIHPSNGVFRTYFSNSFSPSCTPRI